MIKYTLKCDQDHTFDSWFASAAAYDKLDKAGMVSCEICGSPRVKKAIMAPRVKTSDTPAHVDPANTQPAHIPAAITQPANGPSPEIEALRKKIESQSDYVGTNFASEARAMHLGDAPERSIYGEAKPEEAKSLIEDGIPIVPLPFTPKRKAN